MARRLLASPQFVGQAFDRFAASSIWGRMVPTSWLLIHSQQRWGDLGPDNRIDSRTEINLVAEDSGQVFVPSEEIPPRNPLGLELHQHVHVAPNGIKVIAKHGTKKAQLTDTSPAAESRQLLAVERDG